jgi:hypothetical protein
MAGWIAFGASFTTTNSIGTPIHLTGSQCFVKVNAVNLLCGRAVVVVPPALPTFVAITATGLTVTSAGPLWEIAGVSPAAGTTHMVFASPALSPGLSFNADYRFLADGATYAAGFWVLTTQFTARWGAPIAGKKYFVKIVQEQLGMQDSGTVFTAIAS